MKQNPNGGDPLAKSGGRPDIDQLTTEFIRCGPMANGWNRLSDADRVRFCEWDGQHPDGKKHDLPHRKAFPWDNASDTRPMMVDSIINERVALLTAAFWRAITRPKMAATEAAAYAVKLADHFVTGVLYDDLVAEVELSAQHLEQYGWVVLNPTWEQRVSRKRREVRLEEVQALVAQMPDLNVSPQGLLALIQDPAQEDEALRVLREVYRVYVEQQMAGALEATAPDVNEETLRKALKELRVEGVAQVPVPYLCKNEPAIFALRPWDEVFLPPDTTELQRGRAVFQREFVTEAELLARVLEDGYDEAWVKAALKHKGTSTQFLASPFAAQTQATASGAVHTSAPAELVEVIHAVHRTVDDDGVSEIWCTTFHTQVKGDNGRSLYAKHEMLDYPHGEYPYVMGKRENWCRNAIATRGVPVVAATWQNEKKAMADAVVDWTSLGVLPPVNVYKTPGGNEYKFGPAVQNPVIPGKEPKFMDIPGNGVPLAMETEQRLDARVENYFGIPGERVSPERAQTLQASAVQKFLILWSKAIQQLVSLAQKYMPDAEFARATGAPPGWLDQNRDAVGSLAVRLHFDVRELNEELMMKRLETVNKAILPTDVQGVISRGKWVEMQLRAVDPAWAKELIMQAPEASEQLFNQVKADIAQMRLGNPPKLVENDPTAPTKLQFASQIVGANPDYQAELARGGRFAELMQLYAKNLQFSATQDKNRQIGRIGVNPESIQ